MWRWIETRAGVGVGGGGGRSEDVLGWGGLQVRVGDMGLAVGRHSSRREQGGRGGEPLKGDVAV